MINPFENVGLFLVESAFHFYIFIVMLRTVMQWVHADFKNPLFAALSKLTNPALKPLRFIIPTVRGIDIATIVLLVALEAANISILIWVQHGVFPNLLGLIILSFSELLNLLLDIFFYGILVLAILGWLSPLSHGPLIEVLYRVTEPLMRPVRRVIPPIAGLDITPIIIMLVIRLFSIVVVNPLTEIGLRLSTGNG